MAVISQLLRMKFLIMRHDEVRRIETELAEMREEAQQEGDEEKLELVRYIWTSEPLDGTLEWI